MTIHDLWNECVDETNGVPACLELYTKKIRKQLIEEIKNVMNPYPKDIFVWDNKEDIKITRGRFNKFIHFIVENVRQEIIRNLMNELENLNSEPDGSTHNKDLTENQK